jgi:glucose-induced degradation protein 4
MPTPHLETVSPITSSATNSYIPLADQTSSLQDMHDQPMAPAGSIGATIAPKLSRNEEIERTRDIHTPVSVEDGPTTESDQRSIVSHGGLASPEPIATISEEGSRRNESTSTYSSSMDYRLYRPLSEARYRPNSSSTFLKPGARFTGMQRSEKQEYEVVVDVQHVDMAESFMCGYLRIHALTAEHPTLTTYFEGEMIGTKYSFITKHSDWEASDKIDFQHWARFPAWRPLQKDAKKSSFVMKNWAQKENIWMRWKELFLVPDHNLRELTGASFDGFYYICFNQISGSIMGTYYHKRCEK